MRTIDNDRKLTDIEKLNETSKDTRHGILLLYEYGVNVILA